MRQAFTVSLKHQAIDAARFIARGGFEDAFSKTDLSATNWSVELAAICAAVVHLGDSAHSDAAYLKRSEVLRLALNSFLRRPLGQSARVEKEEAISAGFRDALIAALENDLRGNDAVREELVIRIRRLNDTLGERNCPRGVFVDFLIAPDAQKAGERVTAAQEGRSVPELAELKDRLPEVVKAARARMEEKAKAERQIKEGRPSDEKK